MNEERRIWHWSEFDIENSFLSTLVKGLECLCFDLFDKKGWLSSTSTSCWWQAKKKATEHIDSKYFLIGL